MWTTIKDDSCNRNEENNNRNRNVKQLAIPKITNKVIHDVSMHKMDYGLYGGNTEKMLVYDMVLWYSA